MKQLLLLAVIHLLIFHQYKKDKKEVLASKNNKPAGAMIIPGEKTYLISGNRMSKTNAANDSLLTSMQPRTLKPIHASYIYPAIPAIAK